MVVFYAPDFSDRPDEVIGGVCGPYATREEADREGMARCAEDEDGDIEFVVRDLFTPSKTED